MSRTLREVMADDLAHRLEYLGGTLVPHVEGGYEAALSPRLRLRLLAKTGGVKSINRLTADEIVIGTALTRAIHSLYRQEVRDQ